MPHAEIYPICERCHRRLKNWKQWHIWCEIWWQIVFTLKWRRDMNAYNYSGMEN